MNDMFYKTEYCLKYKDTVVFKFNIQKQTITMIDASLLPISLQNKNYNFDLVRTFCANRILMLNREYCKEILTACGIDDQSDVNICIVCKGLSFRDNYWISKARSRETWKDVNLYENKFSLDISRVALTGNMQGISIDDAVSDKIFTGELTSKGTRAKCYYRSGTDLLLYKHESIEEIMSEMITYYIALALSVPCSEYKIQRLFDRECSVCKILTSERYELVPCRDVMSHFNKTTLRYDEDVYATFMKVDAVNFIKMQILDYVTLNTDRNRDNFGLLRVDGKLCGLYPLFDHDSCFKGKSTNGIYFPTGTTFAETLKLLKSMPQYREISECIRNFKEVTASQPFKALYLQYKSLEEYNSMLKRVNNLDGLRPLMPSRSF